MTEPNAIADAVDFLTQYAGYIRESAKADDFERHPYLPSIDATIAELVTQAPLVNRYLIWSNEHRAWWGPNERGYTRDIDRAARYDRDKAFAISRTRGGGWLHGDNPFEIAVPEQDAIAQWAARRGQG